jgi:hypothetical protein
MLDMDAVAATVAVSPIAALVHRPRQLLGYLALADATKQRLSPERAAPDSGVRRQ